MTGVQTCALPISSAGTAAVAATSACLPGPVGNEASRETDDCFDIGAQRALGSFTAAIDAYWRKARNLIDEGRFGAAGEMVAFNYDRGRFRGIELSMTHRASRLSG